MSPEGGGRTAIGRDVPRVTHESRQILDCPICGSRLLGVHGKAVCANCGYCEDCTDLFPAAPTVSGLGRCGPPPDATRGGHGVTSLRYTARRGYFLN